MSSVPSVKPTGRVHDLKCWPEFYPVIESGLKPFEIRYDDRGYQVGDVLRIHEYEPLPGDAEGQYTGREVERIITYKTAFQQQSGWVVLGVQPVKP